MPPSAPLSPPVLFKKASPPSPSIPPPLHARCCSCSPARTLAAAGAMAAFTTTAAGSAVAFARPAKAINVSSVSFAGLRKNNVAFTLQPVTQRFAVLRAAKKETVEKVCDIVKKQLVLPEGTDVTGASKFTDLGADSLDTVEIVMGLEEAFKISVDESSAQSIATVEDAAELIDKIVSNAK
ncbi:acyl carrier protein 2, chloroplastic [Oryza sativa Japonica Group]|uniref:acyl carrier protein 2, chloroplastic n=1 Tax=Oryza sativa subsp. japonica TaxID=39947 RepID=UPI0007754199|nr:acyl carrier protein 2, chloroplastic [Oryza sativa Japonica Group]KAF2917290.1 hypothetical protein DAI22_09g181000 [Oryza sativa Japonica Group]